MSDPAHTTSRRNFLKTATAAGVAAPSFVPANVLAGSGRPGANDRIQVGLIGAGGMGRANLANCAKYPDVVVTGICDIGTRSRQFTPWRPARTSICRSPCRSTWPRVWRSNAR